MRCHSVRPLLVCSPVRRRAERRMWMRGPRRKVRRDAAGAAGCGSACGSCGAVSITGLPARAGWDGLAGRVADEAGDTARLARGGGEVPAVRAFVVAGHPDLYRWCGGVDDQGFAFAGGQGADLLGGEGLAVVEGGLQAVVVAAALPGGQGFPVL